MWNNPVGYQASLDVQHYRPTFDNLVKEYYNVTDIDDFIIKKIKTYNYNAAISWSLFSIRLYAELEFEDENGIKFVRELLNSLEDSNILFAINILLNLKLKENENNIKI